MPFCNICAKHKKLVGALGLEPRTYGLKDRYSCQLSYTPIYLVWVCYQTVIQMSTVYRLLVLGLYKL